MNIAVLARIAACPKKHRALQQSKITFSPQKRTKRSGTFSTVELWAMLLFAKVYQIIKVTPVVYIHFSFCFHSFSLQVKTYMAYCKKYKPCILKYMACNLK